MHIPEKRMSRLFDVYAANLDENSCNENSQKPDVWAIYTLGFFKIITQTHLDPSQMSKVIYWTDV